MPWLIPIARIMALISIFIAPHTQKVWAQTLEAENGMHFRILQIMPIDNRWRGGDKPYVSVNVANEDNRVASLTFDCEGHYADDTNRWKSVPSRSVLAEIGRISCKKLTNAR